MNCAERAAGDQATTDQKYCASTEPAKTVGAAFARQYEFNLRSRQHQKPAGPKTATVYPLPRCCKEPSPIRVVALILASHPAGNIPTNPYSAHSAVNPLCRYTKQRDQQSNAGTSACRNQRSSTTRRENQRVPSSTLAADCITCAGSFRPMRVDQSGVTSPNRAASIPR